MSQGSRRTHRPAAIAAVSTSGRLGEATEPVVIEDDRQLRVVHLDLEARRGRERALRCRMVASSPDQPCQCRNIASRPSPWASLAAQSGRLARRLRRSAALRKLSFEFVRSIVRLAKVCCADKAPRNPPRPSRPRRNAFARTARSGPLRAASGMRAGVGGWWRRERNWRRAYSAA
jgi:hypothetical protein